MLNKKIKEQKLQREKTRQTVNRDVKFHIIHVNHWLQRSTYGGDVVEELDNMKVIEKFNNLLIMKNREIDQKLKDEIV